MKEINDLNMIRSQVRSNIGKDVIVEADKGRNEIVTNKGTISQVFPSLFTIKITNEYDSERTISYTYSDILTSTVKLELC
ncbi:Veg family protein [Finegoldia magna]|uniref:Veg family protein n=1 Tax=Finegoldia magna TaxID=1260 RepID=UPI00290195EA|nr:Veg family protein [Finegoldia magna]MDU2218906.1 Veg family protein [Finegoldia magna]